LVKNTKAVWVKKLEMCRKYEELGRLKSNPRKKIATKENPAAAIKPSQPSTYPPTGPSFILFFAPEASN